MGGGDSGREIYHPMNYRLNGALAEKKDTVV
jgi:hypothetical protein